MKEQIIEKKKKEKWVEEVIDLIHGETIQKNLSFYFSDEFYLLINKGYNEGLAPIEFIFKYL